MYGNKTFYSPFYSKPFTQKTRNNYQQTQKFRIGHSILAHGYLIYCEGPPLYMEMVSMYHTSHQTHTPTSKAMNKNKISNEIVKILEPELSISNSISFSKQSGLDK